MHVLVRLDLGRGVVLEVTGLVHEAAVPALAQVVARAQALSPEVAVDATGAEVDQRARRAMQELARDGDDRCRPFTLELDRPCAGRAGTAGTLPVAVAPDAEAPVGA